MWDRAVATASPLNGTYPLLVVADSFPQVLLCQSQALTSAAKQRTQRPEPFSVLMVNPPPLHRFILEATGQSKDYQDSGQCDST
jgi:hypothetical protein